MNFQNRKTAASGASAALAGMTAVLYLLSGTAAAGEIREPFYPDADTALYESYDYGSYTADALRAAGGTTVAVIDNASVLLLANGGDVPLGRCELAGTEFEQLLEQAVACVRTDSDLEAVVSEPEELGGFLQISGFFLCYDPSAPSGDRVVSVELDDGTPLIADTIWITAPEYLIKELDTAVETLEVGARQAMAEYLAQAEEENGTNKRIKVMGTVDGTIVSAFPRWVVILLPLLAAILVCQSLFRNQKWKDAHGVFLRRSR